MMSGGVIKTGEKGPQSQLVNRVLRCAAAPRVSVDYFKQSSFSFSVGSFSLSHYNQVRQVDEETRLNNGFSIQVSSYQQEALNLCFFSLIWR